MISLVKLCPRCGGTGEEPGVPWLEGDAMPLCDECHGAGVRWAKEPDTPLVKATRALVAASLSVAAEIEGPGFRHHARRLARFANKANMALREAGQ